jgi:hypothetical protein
MVLLLHGSQRGGTVRGSSVGRAEEIPYAPSCADVVVVAATIGKPLSETGDGRLKYMNVLSIVLWPPHFGEQMPVGDDLARVAGEQAQQSVFDGRERRFFVGYLHQTLGKVDDEGP